MTLSTLLRNTLNYGAVAGAATAIGLLTVPAAQALTIADIKAPGYSFTLTDKTFSDFGNFVGFNDADTVTFNLAAGVHRFQIQSANGW